MDDKAQLNSVEHIPRVYTVQSVDLLFVCMVKNVEMLRLGCRGPSDISQKPRILSLLQI